MNHPSFALPNVQASLSHPTLLTLHSPSSFRITGTLYTTMATSGPPFAVSPFLALPAEIRLRIYKLVFEGNEVTVRATRVTTRSFAPSRSPSFRYQILLACRQCNNEARQVFYQQTTWIIGSKQIFKHFISTGSASHDLSYVQRVQLDQALVPGPLFAWLWSLKSLTVTMESCTCDDCVEEDPVNRRPWTQAGQVEAKLEDIGAYMGERIRRVRTNKASAGSQPPQPAKRIPLQLRLTFWKATYDDEMMCYYDIPYLKASEEHLVNLTPYIYNVDCRSD